jgi:hypothetical protein
VWGWLATERDGGLLVLNRNSIPRLKHLLAFGNDLRAWLKPRENFSPTVRRSTNGDFARFEMIALTRIDYKNEPFATRNGGYCGTGNRQRIALNHNATKPGETRNQFYVIGQFDSDCKGRRPFRSPCSKRAYRAIRLWSTQTVTDHFLNLCNPSAERSGRIGFQLNLCLIATGS